MILTDTDILNLLNREIVIVPFDDSSLTPVGYDLRVGDFVYSLERGLLHSDSVGSYTINPSESILILTKEFIWISDHIAGTFHSKVSLVSRGFSHISTTLDPGWTGPLLIATSNRNNKALELNRNQQFTTLVFHRTKSRATRHHEKPPARIDILVQLLTNPNQDAATRDEMIKSQKELAQKVSQTLEGTDAQKEFAEKVELASEQGLVKVIHATRTQLRSRGKYYLYLAIHVLLLALIALLPLYFDIWLKPFFPNIEVDSSFFAGALGATMVVMISLINQLRK